MLRALFLACWILKNETGVHTSSALVSAHGLKDHEKF